MRHSLTYSHTHALTNQPTHPQLAENDLPPAANAFIMGFALLEMLNASQSFALQAGDTVASY